MVIIICPRCQSRHVVDKYVVDFVCQCDSGNAALDNEDVHVVGDWEDYTGSAVVDKGLVHMRGVSNKLFGTRADVCGEFEGPITVRGNNSQIFRSRQHLEFVEVNKDGCY